MPEQSLPDYRNNYKTPGFSDTPRWDVLIDDVKISWMPIFPYVVSDGTAEGDRIAAEISKSVILLDDYEGSDYKIPAVGPVVTATPSCPHAVRYVIDVEYGDYATLVYSENAPTFEVDEDDEPLGNIVY